MIQFLFASSLCVSSLLIFVLELYVGKLLLPLYGGSASVWTSSLFFFQSCLFLGYSMACLLRYYVSDRLQYWGVIVALLLAALFLPIQISTIRMLGNGDFDTILSIVGTLTTSIGVPFVVLSLMSPLLQHWFQRSFPEHGNPYALYAASNGGSFLGLLLFPFILERYFSLPDINLVWLTGFAILALMILAIVWKLVAIQRPLHSESNRDQSEISWASLSFWILSAALPSSLLMGVSAVLTQNIAPFPLIWVLPLVIYFMTYIIAFLGFSQSIFDFLRRLAL
ncbi:MAG: hypothetical protein KDD62_13550, partial [Bdellovibrionales bacterium]|nr:hypothetical protein [Bdellovibrionales bacterium]